jgi:pimeloyl-ACP methyl ester carboxylesterase
MKRAIQLLILMVLVSGAVLAQAASETERTRSADGTEIAFEVQGSESPALVFIHGWSCDRTYWRNQIQPFATRHRVVTLDLAGHGESATGRQDYTMAAFGADVAAVLEAAGVEDAVLVGHSMGGPVAVEAALLAPERVRGIIGVDNFQDFNPEIPQAQAEAFINAVEQNFIPVVDAWVRSMFPAGADSVLRAGIAADMAAADPRIGVSAMRNTLPWMSGGGVPSLKQLQVNLITISSDMHETNVEANRKIVPGFTLKLMKGVGHFPMLEEPERFNELLAEAVDLLTGDR